MELIGLVLGGILCLYLVWKLTKAILTAVLVTITLGVLLYVGAPYVLTDTQLETFKSATEDGENLIGEQLERAKSFTEDGVVKPIQDSLKVPTRTPKK
ncbi:MAG: hypothetical protein ACPGQS_02530 [Bradymonadia bacterium]